MAARYYESNTSGMNFDRFLDRLDETTVSSMKKHYWTAKQVIRSKMGKKEDEHLLASDAQLDGKLTLFRSLRDTSERLLMCIENYQSHLLDATMVENELGRYLKVQGKREKRDETTRVMVAVGRALMLSSHQRAAVREPLVRFYQELQVFSERAIADCASTVEATERARTRYRGSLLWIKNCSEELDPDTDRQLEKFREAQTAVRANKELLDKLKVDTMQKVELLSASRCNLLCHLLCRYTDMMTSFYGKTASTYHALADHLAVFQHYEFEILTELIEPSKRVARKVRQASLEKGKFEKQRTEQGEGEAETQSCQGANLLSFDEVDASSMESFLFGRKSPVERESVRDEERPDSPLGLLDDTAEEAVEELDAQERRIPSIGPLPASFLDLTAHVPRLAPPPSGGVANSGVAGGVERKTTAEGKVDGFESHELFPVMREEPRGTPSAPSGDLLDLIQPANNSFPNPFDSSSNEWDQLLSQCDMQQLSEDLL